jgi:hypothetical protein
VASFIIAVWHRGYSVMVISTQSPQVAEKIQKWAERQGWRVDVKRMGGDGPEHK